MKMIIISSKWTEKENYFKIPTAIHTMQVLALHPGSQMTDVCVPSKNIDSREINMELIFGSLIRFEKSCFTIM
jgi:hypothetical protein